MKFEAETKELGEHFVLGMRHIGPYTEINKTMEKLFAVVGPAGLLNVPQTQVLSVFHDDPDKVEPSQLRSDVCITVPNGTKALEGTHTFSIPGGRFAVAHVEILGAEYPAAWKKLQSEWIPTNSLQIDANSGRMCYEVYLNNPAEHPDKKHIVDICEPVL